MNLKEFKELLKENKIGLAEGIEETKILPLASICKKATTQATIDLLHSHNYDLSALSITSFRLLTINEKELEALKPVLAEIDALNLQEVFQNNLNIVSLKREVIARIKNCLNNNIPFIYPDSNTLIPQMYNEQSYNDYIAQAKVSEVADTPSTPVYPNNEPTLDEEDTTVRTEVLTTLLEIKEQNKEDFTFNFLITNIIANLDNVIISDNKAYRTKGTRHLIKNALQGVSLTEEMQEQVNNQLLVAFPEVSLNAERSAA